MAFAKSVTVKGSKYSYHLNPAVKHFTLRDSFFQETAAGNFQFSRPVESTPHAKDGGLLKITVAKDLSGLKMSLTSNDGMRSIDIFKDENKKNVQDQFYFIMDDLIERKVLEKD